MLPTRFRSCQMNALSRRLIEHSKGRCQCVSVVDKVPSKIRVPPNCRQDDELCPSPRQRCSHAISQSSYHFCLKRQGFRCFHHSCKRGCACERQRERNTERH